MDEIKGLLQKGKSKEALALFNSLSEEKQEEFLRAMVPHMFPPSAVGILYRKLREGEKFEDFYKAWLPPLKEGQELDQYFPCPVYVMHGQFLEDATLKEKSDKDASEIISIGLVWGDPAKLAEMLKPYKETEHMRHESIDKVAEKLGGSAVYVVKDVTKLGS